MFASTIVCLPSQVMQLAAEACRWLCVRQQLRHVVLFEHRTATSQNSLACNIERHHVFVVCHHQWNTASTSTRPKLQASAGWTPGGSCTAIITATHSPSRQIWLMWYVRFHCTLMPLHTFAFEVQSVLAKICIRCTTWDVSRTTPLLEDLSQT
jgi:hypothetical protein